MKGKSILDYVYYQRNKKMIDVCFFCENSKPFLLGKKMEQINHKAYMNGYNWERFLEYYLLKNMPDILVGMHSDPEAGMYAAYYDSTNENEKRAIAFCEIISSLIEDEEKTLQIIREEGNRIQWE